MNGESAGRAIVELAPAQFRVAVVAVLLLILIGTLDQMMVGVALPAIARSMGGLEGMGWVVSAFLIAATAVTPVFGKLSDLYGRRPALVIALAAFLVGSIGCALAQSLGTLVAGRVLQGAGAGGIVALSQAVTADIVALRERGRFQGYSAMVWAASSAAGPLLAGVLTQSLSWRWIFWIDVPLGVLAWLLVARSLRGLPVPERPTAVDWQGALLLVGALVCMLIPFALMAQGRSLGGSTLALFAVAAALGWLFWRQQRGVSDPMLPLEVLRDRALLRCCGLLFVSFFVFAGCSLLVPMRLQLTAGMSAVQAGAQLVWLTLAAQAAVFGAGRWMLHRGTVRPLQRIGACLVPLALCWMALADPRLELAMCAALAVLGVGIGLQIPATMVMVQGVVARQMLGTATGMTSFFRSFGATMGAAVLGAIVLAALGPAQGVVTIASDSAFRTALCCGMVLSLASLWLVRGLPDVHLHAQSAAPTPD